MATKYFCDGCDSEITNENKCRGGTVTPACDIRLGTTIQKGGVKVGVEVMTSMDGTANKGLFCKYCVLDALYKLDDRPKLAECHTK